MEEKIEIPLSKLKIALLLIAAIAFAVLGILFAINPEQWAGTKSPEFIRIMGVISTIFAGIGSIFIGRKLFDEKLGLTIDNEGITDNTSATSVGLIDWEDIVGIERVEIASTKILLILTNKPDKYIERAKNGLAKRAMKSNYKMYGTPISIISSPLKMKFTELENLIVSEFNKRQ